MIKGDIEFIYSHINKRHELHTRRMKPDGEYARQTIAYFTEHREGYDMTTIGQRFFIDDDAWIVAKHALEFLDALKEAEDEEEL